MLNDNSIQGVILDTVAKENRQVRLFTTNGFRINGKVIAADQYTVLVEDNTTGEQSLVYKHAISTIMLPSGRNFYFDKKDEEK